MGLIKKSISAFVKAKTNLNLNILLPSSIADNICGLAVMKFGRHDHKAIETTPGTKNRFIVVAVMT